MFRNLPFLSGTPPFLRPSWESEVMSYGERKAKREQEIEGLKEALTILSGEALLQASALFWARIQCGQ